MHCSWNRENVCRSHGKPLDVFCCTERMVMCEQCASEGHEGHRIGLVAVERSRTQEEVKTMHNKFKQLLKEQKKKEEDMEAMLDQIQKEARATDHNCEAIFTIVIDSLQKHYHSVRELIDRQERAEVSQLNIARQKQHLKLTEMKRREAQLEELAETKDNAQFLQDWPSLQLRCEDDLLSSTFPVLSDPLVPLKFTIRCVQRLESKVQEFSDQLFASLIQMAGSGEQQDSGGERDEDDMEQECQASVSASQGFSAVLRTLNEPKVAPKTREQFLQYACEISLDPETAHEGLEISVGGKEVRLSPQRSNNSGLRSPHRFTLRRQVLCREALHAERCYYEVKVEGDKMEIALCYKGIGRTSCTSRSAFGANAKSWSLDRSTKYSVSHKGDSVQLTTLPSENRIGVYLQFQEGTLSFYEVGDSMKFLYKVEATFAEPLYPGFWLGDNSCITICDLKK